MRIVTLPSSLSHCKCISTLFLESCVMRKLVFDCSDQVLGVLTRSESYYTTTENLALDFEIWVNKRYRD